MSIAAGEIEKLVREHEYAVRMGRNDYEINAGRSQLAQIADATRYEGLVVDWEDTAHEERVRGFLKEYGHSTVEYMYGD